MGDPTGGQSIMHLCEERVREVPIGPHNEVHLLEPLATAAPRAATAAVAVVAARATPAADPFLAAALALTAAAAHEARDERGDDCDGREEHNIGHPGV